MTCEEIRGQLSFYLYGELTLDQEEIVDAHLDGCAGCRAELQRQRSMHALFDQREMLPSPLDLREQRLKLQQALEHEESRHSWWRQFVESLRLPVVMKPVGAMALLAMGFFGARLAPNTNLPLVGQASVFDPNNARVRYVEQSPEGRVQIVVDETRQRVLSGRLEDAHIRGLLLAAVKDPSDPGLRVESVELLKSKSENDDVRTTLINVLQHDTNDGVRLKALEGLKPFAGSADVRKALRDALMNDRNPSIRAQAIDVLMTQSQEQAMVGLLQEVVHKEDNTYIRLRCEKALHAMKASVGSY